MGQGPPYLDWKLDRWKLGVAIVLLLVLMARFVDRQWLADLAVRQGIDAGWLLAGDRASPTATAAIPTAAPSVSPIPDVVQVNPDPAAETVALALEVAEVDETGVVYTDRPTLSGDAAPGARLVLQIDDRRYDIEADETGTWRFTLPEPLAPGMSWIQIGSSDGSLPPISRMVLVAAPAAPTAAVALAVTETPPPSPTATPSPTPSPQPTATPPPSPTATLVSVGQPDPDESPVAAGPTAIASPTLTVTATLEDDATAAPAVPDPPTAVAALRELELQVVDVDEAGLIHTRRPTLTGIADPGAVLTIIVDDRQYEVQADGDGAWRLTLPDPLSPGMTWVQVAAAEGSIPPISRMLLLVATPESPAETVALAPTATVPAATATPTASAEGVALASADAEARTENGGAETSLPPSEAPTEMAAILSAGTPEPMVTETPLPPIETPEPTETRLATATATATMPPTDMPEPTAPETSLPPTQAPTETATVPPTETPEPTATPSPQPAETLPATPTATATVAVLPTETSEPTAPATETPVVLPTARPTLTASTETAQPAVAGDNAVESLLALQILDADEAGVVYTGQPTLTGVAAPNMQLTLQVDDRQYEVQADEAGAWRFTLPEPLAPGMSWVQVAAADGGISPVSQMVMVASAAPATEGVASEAEAAPPVLQIVDQDEAGVVQTGQPTLAGTAAPWALLYLQVDDQRYWLQADGEGAWRFTLSEPLAPGISWVQLFAAGSDDLLAAQMVMVAVAAPATEEVALAATPATTAGNGLRILDADETGVVYTSHPTLAGAAGPGTLLTLQVDDRQYEVRADESGTWRFTLPEPLAPGMSWVQIFAAGAEAPLAARTMLLAAPALPERVAGAPLLSEGTATAANGEDGQPYLLANVATSVAQVLWDLVAAAQPAP